MHICQLNRCQSSWIEYYLLLCAFSLIGSMSGCAGIASGAYGTDLDVGGRPVGAASNPAGLRISAGEVDSMSSTYFGEIEFTFENPTPHWIRIEQVKLDFGSERNNNDVYVPWGNQLENWFDSTRQCNVIREANTETALSLLAIGGAIVSAGAGRGSGGLRAAGGLVALSATAALVGKEIQDRKDAAENVPVFAQSHLFGGAIDVPPGLFVKRWIVVNTPADPYLQCLTSVTMTYVLGDQTSHRVLLDFRYHYVRSPHSEWQRSVCRR